MAIIMVRMIPNNPAMAMPTHLPISAALVLSPSGMVVVVVGSGAEGVGCCVDSTEGTVGWIGVGSRTGAVED